MTSSSHLIAVVRAEVIATAVFALPMLCVLLAGIVKCVSIARRPTANTMCLLSLICVLIWWAFLIVVVCIAELGKENKPAMVAVVLLTLPAMGCLMAAPVLGIIGLRSYSRHRDQFTQGRGQAVAAILMSAIVLGLGILGVIRGALQEELGAGGASRIANSNWLPALRKFDDCNLEVKLPAGPWHEMEAKQLEPLTKMMYMRSDPSVVMLVTAEKIGVESGLDSESAAHLAANKLLAAGQDGKILEERAEDFHGVPGVYFEAQLIEQRLLFYHSILAVAHNGFFYKLACYGEPTARDAIRAAQRELSENCRLIDPSRVAHADGFESADKFTSNVFDYRADFGGTNWSSWPTVGTEVGGAEFGVRRGQGAFLFVIPIELTARKTDLDLLTNTMLSRLNVVHPGNEVRKTVPITVRGFSGKAVDVHRDAPNKCDLHVRIVAANRCAYVIAGLVTDGNANLLPEIDSAIERVEIGPGEPHSDDGLPEAIKVASALVVNDLGIAAQRDNDLEAAVEYLERANQLRPDDDAIFENYLQALMLTNRPKQAAEILDQQVARFPDKSSLRLVQARLLMGQGESTKARAVYAQPLSDGLGDDSDLLAFVNAAVEAEDYDQAITVVEKVLTKRSSVSIRRWQAALYGRKGDLQKSIDLFKKLRDQYPTDRPTTFDLADAQAASGDFAAALEVTQQLIDSGTSDVATLLLHARIQLQLRWYAKARETYEKVAQSEPANKEARDGLQYISSMLGQGDNSLVKTEIEALQLPAAVRSAIKAAQETGTTDGADKFGAEEQLRVTGYEFQPGQRLRRTDWRRIKVFNTGGVTQFGILPFRFEPSVERMYVNRLVVFDANGKQVSEGSANDYYVLDENSTESASQAKVLNVPVPGLKPGYTLEYVVTTQDLSASDAIPFEEEYLSAIVPTTVSAIFVHAPTASLVYKSERTTPVQVTPDLLYCVQSRPQPITLESLEQPLAEFLPVLRFSGKGGSWEALAREYLESIAGKLTSDDSVQKLAVELTKDCRTKEEKIAAIATHVQQACTYHAIEFGRRARVPNPPSHTLRLKYGDCKDHATLAWSLLRAADIPAQLALANTRGELLADMPSLDQFNHMIVFVPKSHDGEPAPDAEGMFIDCTSKDTNAALTPPFGLADRQVFLLDADHPRIVRTPAYPKDAAQIVSKRRITISASAGDGGAMEAKVHEQVAFNSYAGPGMRSYLRLTEPAKRSDAIQGLLSGDEPVRVQSVTIKNLEEPQRPLIVETDYLVPDAFHRVDATDQGAMLTGRLLSPWEDRFLAAEYVQHRESPFEIEIPLRVESSVEVELPPHYRLQNWEQLSGRKQSSYVAWAARSAQNEQQVTLEYRLRRPAGRYAADAYSSYYDDMKDSLKTFHLPWTLRAVTP